MTLFFFSKSIFVNNGQNWLIDNNQHQIFKSVSILFHRKSISTELLTFKPLLIIIKPMMQCQIAGCKNVVLVLLIIKILLIRKFFCENFQVFVAMNFQVVYEQKI